MKQKIIFSFLFILAIILTASILKQPAKEKCAPALRLKYDFPAENWESQALPLGNGYMGAMIFGGVNTDLIQVNEHTIWSGGPGANPNYDGGHKPEAKEGEIRTSLQKARREIQRKMNEFSENHSAYIDENGNLVTANYNGEDEALKNHIKENMGVKNEFGGYQTLGNIHIDNLKSDINYSNYQRSLDIDSALVKVEYVSDGAENYREYFMNYPENVMVVRYSSNKNNNVSRAIWIDTPQPNVEISAEGNIITMTGRPSDHNENGLNFAQQLIVINKNGDLSTEGDKILVEDADEIIILMSAASNYLLCKDESFNFFTKENPLFKVKENLEGATQYSYEDLKRNHIEDYVSLYEKMCFNPGNISDEALKMTDKLLEGYKNGTNTENEDRYLEQLYFQFGRYLMIASSRENTLPANLQGIWAEGLQNAWNSDYHTNINLQMNYWPVQTTNLGSCHLPLIEWIKTLVPRGKITAKKYYCTQTGSDVRGWVCNHENNIWANTAPSNWYTAFYFPTAAAWCCQDIWEYYQFTCDKEFLAENYDILQDAALFWVDNLWIDERDGKLVTNPAYSPEHGDFSMGTSADQAIITELFDFVIKAAGELDKSSPEIDEIKGAKAKLLGPQIGLGGQFMEWRDEITLDQTGDNHHRHANHLHWLHPGTQIIADRSKADNDYVNAMKKALNTRGDGGTGWSKAWKINFWARLRDGNRAHKLLKEQLNESTLQNLFDNHPPFQIDGNFGATAGMAEMLIQSHGDKIEILPALSQEWKQGRVKGLKARGNFEIEMTWDNSALQAMSIKSLSGKKCYLKYPGIDKTKITTEKGEVIDFETINENEISFETIPDSEYLIKKVS